MKSLQRNAVTFMAVCSSSISKTPCGDRDGRRRGFGCVWACEGVFTERERESGEKEREVGQTIGCGDRIANLEEGVMSPLLSSPYMSIFSL